MNVNSPREEHIQWFKANANVFLPLFDNAWEVKNLRTYQVFKVTHYSSDGISLHSTMRITVLYHMIFGRDYWHRGPTGLSRSLGGFIQRMKRYPTKEDLKTIRIYKQTIVDTPEEYRLHVSWSFKKRKKRK